MSGKKLIVLLTLIVTSLVMFFFFLNINKPKHNVGSDFGAPGIDVKDEKSGRQLISKDFKNKVVFINFWATWCPPCREEMPSIESLYKNMSGNDKFQMVTILYKDTYQNGTAYMQQNGYTFPVYSDAEGNTAVNYGVTGVPETYIIDKKGTLKKRVIGPAEWNSPEAKNFINSLLNE